MNTSMDAKPNVTSNLFIRRTCGLVACVICCLLLAPQGRAEDAAASDEWVPLFNGKDLDGWTPKFAGYDLGENYKNTFRVEDGVLKVAYDEYEKMDGRFGHLFYKQPYSNYRLRVEYRFVGDQVSDGPGWAFRNNGIMLHCQDPATMDKDQDFPVSIEVQLLGGKEEGERPTANVCTPGTNIVIDGKLVTQHCINSTSKTCRGDQWVTVEVEVLGGETIRHFVNGELVFEYASPQLDPNDKDAKKLIKDGNLALERGYIALQAESHPTEFRKIEIMSFDP